MDKVILKNGIEAVIKTNKNTPRTAIVLYIRHNNKIHKEGLYFLLASLLFQGTKNRSAEELAQELDENAIEIYFDTRYDYMRFKILCLNEDVEHALEIFKDMFENSTLDNFKKEAKKIKGELESELDSAKAQALDEYYRTLYKNHPYGTGRKETIEQIEKITKNELTEAFYQLKSVSDKNIFVACDKNADDIVPILEKYLDSFSVKDCIYPDTEVGNIEENRISTIIKDDANQAQIYMGWLAPSIISDEFPAFVLLNTLLGASGLSSRLFLELREKQGLAYTVRSCYETFRLGNSFYVYIATEPKNIKTSINGFKKEIDKIMNEIISDEELENAKNNAIGKRQFYFETNISEATTRGLYRYWGFDFDYEEKLIRALKNTTKESIMKYAKEYFSRCYALCVLAPEKYLKEADLI